MHVSSVKGTKNSVSRNGKSILNMQIREGKGSGEQEAFGRESGNRAKEQKECSAAALL